MPDGAGDPPEGQFFLLPPLLLPWRAEVAEGAVLPAEAPLLPMQECARLAPALAVADRPLAPHSGEGLVPGKGGLQVIAPTLASLVLVLVILLLLIAALRLPFVKVAHGLLQRGRLGRPRGLRAEGLRAIDQLIRPGAWPPRHVLW